MAPARTPRVLLQVTGGIAAYKSCFLARLLMKAGFSVRVAMTRSAQRFVTPMTFQALTGHPVAADLWGEGQSEALDHIEYARWADMVVVAPATANIMAKAAHGIADEIVSTLLLAFPGPVLMAPAMNDNMWRHPATQANREVLESRGVHLVGPGSGWLACGTIDTGRMAEPEEILTAAIQLAGSGVVGQDVSLGDLESVYWSERKVVVTAGPTHEAIDPVRYLANRSTGAMGLALASGAARLGARVTLILGPSALTPPRGLEEIRRVESAEQMAEAVQEALKDDPDWLLMTAAVADFAPKKIAGGKLKKSDLGENWDLSLNRTTDILGDIVAPNRPSGMKVLGFALETSDLESAARRKLESKGLDYIAANDPTAEGSGFGPGSHVLTLMGPKGEAWTSESMPKPELAMALLRELARVEAS